MTSRVTGLLWVVCLLFCPAFLPTGQLWALDGSKALAQEAHRIWGQEEGLFQPTVYSILQTRDGLLWLGTQDSLIRFDGVHFREFDNSSRAPLHRSLVRDLAEDPRGNLWVASVGEGLFRLPPGQEAARFQVQNGLPSNDVFCVDTAAGSDVWACTNRGLSRFDGHSFRTYSTADGLPTNSVRSTCLAKNGVRWVAGLDFGLAQSHGSRFAPYEDALLSRQTPISALLCGNDGTVWAGTDSGLVHIGPAGSKLIDTSSGLPDNQVLSLHEGQNGTLWIGTNDGITRWRNGELSVYRTHDGLSHSTVLSLYEDREGTLWAGTKDGLDQFTDGKLTPYTHQQGLSSDDIGPVLEDRDHRLWVGTVKHGLNVYEKSRFRALTTADGLAGNTILSLELDAAGDLWIGTTEGLNRLHHGLVNGTFHRQQGLSGEEIRTIFSDIDGTLWVGTDKGLDRWDGMRFVPARVDRDPVGAVLALGGGRIAHLIVSTSNQGMYTLRNGAATHTDNDVSRPVDCFFVDRSHEETWMGTLGSGLLRYRNGTLAHIRVKDGLYDNRIYSILRDDQANFWLASSKGIFRVSQQQLDDFADGKIPYVTSLPFSTGQLRFECQSGVQPAGTRTRDGRLWFSTKNGLVMIDPSHLTTNPVPPPAVLTGVLVSGQPVAFDPGRELRLPPQDRNLEIRYAGLSFVSPERVTFRYMLKGYDNSWTDAGVRREAFFTNLPPGPFEFQVSARNADGVWSVHPASFHFFVKPRFYQHIWFFPLLAAAAALLFAALYRMRVRQIRKTFSLVLLERSRIARELHDTLLQGLSGITMQLQALWSALPPSPERQLLLGIIEDAGRCSREARRSLWGLRTLGSDSADFSTKLRRLASEAVNGHCELRLLLPPVSLSSQPEAEYQLLRIAAEAISNSLRHSRASLLTVSLTLHLQRLQMTIEDNGIGFDPEASASFGHYGLAGMRERAGEIGAELNIISKAGQGTAITVSSALANRNPSVEMSVENEVSHHTK